MRANTLFYFGAILVLGCLLCPLQQKAQTGKLDSARLLAVSAPTPRAQWDALIRLSNAKLAIQDLDSALSFAYKALAVTEKHGLKSEEATTTAHIGQVYSSKGNYSRALRQMFKSKKLLEEIKDSSIYADVVLNVGSLYCDLDDFKRGIQFTREAANIYKAQQDADRYGFSLLAIASYFLELNQPDSAYSYIQEGLQTASKAKQMGPLLRSFSDWGMGKYNQLLGNEELAWSYFRKSVQFDVSSFDRLSNFLPMLNYQGMGELAFKNHQPDSAIQFGERCVKHALLYGFPKQLQTAYSKLAAYYAGVDNEKAIGYYKKESALRDSLTNLKTKNEIENMIAEETERQIEKERAVKEAEEERLLIFEYAAIGVFVLLAVALFFVLSQTLLVNEKFIRFLGVLILLISFEFVNLVLHPVIGSITHHTPMLMLLALVLLASLLVPAHHKLEKWILTKVVEKNKRIRLERAKAIIKELEENNQQESTTDVGEQH